MPVIYKWSNVQVGIETLTPAPTAVPITGITKANPGVITAAGHGLVNGDWFRTNIDQGMRQVDDRVFRASGVAADAVAMEGTDTTLFDDFGTGDLTEVTFGTFMTTVRGLTASGGDPDFIDVTTIHDTVRKQIPGLTAAINYSMENLWDATDAALIALKAFGDNQTRVAFQFAFAGGAGPKVVFMGYVACNLLPTGNAQDVVVTPVTVTMFGNPTIYPA